MTWGQLAGAISEAPSTRADDPRRHLSLVQAFDNEMQRQALGDSATLALPALYATVRLIASSIDQLPIVADPGQLPRWLEEPRRVGSSFGLGTMVSHLVTDMAVMGAGYLLVTGTRAGWRLEPVRSEQVAVTRSSTGPVRLSYAMDGQPVERFPYWDAERGDGPYLLPVPYLVTPEYPAGVSPLVACGTVIRGFVSVEVAAANLLTNGTHVGGRLVTDSEITPDYGKRVQSAWVQARREGAIPVLGGGLKYEEPRMDFASQQLLESRSFDAMQIAALYGVPPSYLGMSLMGGNSSLSYANAQDNARLFRTNSLAGFTTHIEAALSELMPNGRYAAEARRVRFDWTEWEKAGNANNDNADMGNTDPVADQ